MLAVAGRELVLATVIGTTGGGTLSFTGLFEVSLDELDEAATGTYAALFG